MKTYQNLYTQITSFDNLLRASRNAQKGKRYQDNVVQFNFQLEDELLALRQELEERTYRPGPYRCPL